LLFLVFLAPLVILRLASGPVTHQEGPQAPGGTGDGGRPPAGPGSKGSRPRVLLVLASQDFWFPDYQRVRAGLEPAAEVEVACWKEGKARPAQKEEQPVPVNRRLDTVSASEFDAVVFCGGFGIQEYMTRPGNQGPGPGAGSARKLINDMLHHEKKKYVTAICMGPMILADAGVLNGQRATCELRLSPAREKLEKKGAIVVDDPKEPVVVSGRIVTGRDADVARDFAQKLLELLRNAN
jgi:protease I